MNRYYESPRSDRKKRQQELEREKKMKKKQEDAPKHIKQVDATAQEILDAQNELRAELAKETKLARQLENENAALEHKIIDHDKQSSIKDIQIDRMIRDQEDLEDHIETRRAENRELAEVTKELDKELVDLKSQVQSVNKKLERCASEKIYLRDTLRRGDQPRGDWRAGRQKRTQEDEELIQAKTKEIASLKNEIGKYKLASNKVRANLQKKQK